MSSTYNLQDGPVTAVVTHDTTTGLCQTLLTFNHPSVALLQKLQFLPGTDIRLNMAPDNSITFTHVSADDPRPFVLRVMLGLARKLAKCPQ